MALNGANTKLFTTCLDASAPSVHVNGEESDAAHKYLGRKFFGNLTQRGRISFEHRVQLAWTKFNHFRSVLTNKHVSIKLRFRLLNAVVSPTSLFGLARLPLTKTQVVRLDAL